MNKYRSAGLRELLRANGFDDFQEVASLLRGADPELDGPPMDDYQRQAMAEGDADREQRAEEIARGWGEALGRGKKDPHAKAPPKRGATYEPESATARFFRGTEGNNRDGQR